MTTVLILISLLLATSGAWLLANNRRSVAAYIVIFLSLIPLLTSQTVVKSAFTWLALLGLAGFLVTVAQGLLSGREDVVSDS